MSKLPKRFEAEEPLTDEDFEPFADPGVEDEDEDLFEVAEEIFDAIEDDLRDRSGIGDSFDSVDDEILDEIRQANISRILEVLKREFE